VAGRSLTRDLQSVIDDGTRHAAAFAAMTEDAINHALVQRGLLPPFHRHVTLGPLWTPRSSIA
jgi:hypothetical protein